MYPLSLSLILFTLPQLASFTRQDLHHGYQKGNIGRILERLKAVVYLNLIDNELLELSSFSFPWYFNPLTKIYPTSIQYKY